MIFCKSLAESQFLFHPDSDLHSLINDFLSKQPDCQAKFQ